MCRQCFEVLRAKKAREHAESVAHGGSDASAPGSGEAYEKERKDLRGGKDPDARPYGRESPALDAAEPRPAPQQGRLAPSAGQFACAGEERVCTICGRLTVHIEEIEGKVVCQRCVASGKFKEKPEAADSKVEGETAAGRSKEGAAPIAAGMQVSPQPSPAEEAGERLAPVSRRATEMIPPPDRTFKAPASGESAAAAAKLRLEGGKTCSICWNKFPSDQVVMENGAAVCRKCLESRRSGVIGTFGAAGARSEEATPGALGAITPSREDQGAGGPAAGPMQRSATTPGHETVLASAGRKDGAAGHAEGTGQAKKNVPPDEMKAVEVKKEPPSLIAPIIAGILILIFLVWMFIRLLTAASQEDMPGKKGGMLRPPALHSIVERTS